MTEPTNPIDPGIDFDGDHPYRQPEEQPEEEERDSGDADMVEPDDMPDDHPN